MEQGAALGQGRLCPLALHPRLLAAHRHLARHSPGPPQVTTTINNLILGRIYIDHGGIMKARTAGPP